MDVKKTYKVELSEVKGDKEKEIYEHFKASSKSIFENLTKITLVGLLLQMAKAISSDSILFIAIVLSFLVVVDIAMDLYMFFKFLSSFVLRKRLSACWNVPIFIVFFFLALSFYYFIALPFMGDVFDYYAVQGSK